MFTPVQSIFFFLKYEKCVQVEVSKVFDQFDQFQDMKHVKCFFKLI